MQSTVSNCHLQEELKASISGDALYEHESQLQSFAYAYPERNRIMGGQAHNDTVTYIYNTLSALDYYDVTLQPWASVVQTFGEASLAIDGEAIDEATLMDYSASGNVTAPLVPVANLGCEQVNILFFLSVYVILFRFENV